METLDKHFRSLAKASFESHGFATADLLALWPEIVGADVALLCRPEKIVWPRQGDGRAGAGATLHLAVAAGRTLDIQYKTPQLVERINTFLGHGAIAKLKLHGGAVPRPVIPAVAPAPAFVAEPAPDDPLAAALARLGRAVKAEASATTASSPQAEEARGHTPHTSSRTFP